ncbi:ABC transporter ATP-binding protein [Aeromonas salmonicida]|uniref:ABC-type transport system ATP-binding protein n=1 Tax=Aeromonas salmonicida subsp. pectinolytica 34mel TaxID=1324960 RepID=T0R0J0_AERSA|nr:energy-coupling factor ABC transporter ATP-binding protein [Aeromonas salmonicida]ATP08616.1 ABC-type transport system ATP-binding protein [Aeromonas salmonicida subsp. pectinolytica 34mel]EQC04938.1 ABC-type molybdate transporter ATP-binding protein [Aeromonas salmonicida subsp. pectinolytica 34mel]TNI23787.1 ABC transporter ATP-binding protein [Aeromonas salmonicida]HEH9396347.1 energy-coupling factor ABC transporter ATP-binding protein [Aeromonas salmonicida]HEH9409057.1 energy-coupling 
MALTAHQLMMRFGERNLFQIERLSIAAGDAIWLRGANGVGKTTLLKILAGLLTPTRGHTNLACGWRARLAQWIKRDPGPGLVTYLHQTPYLFDRSVHDNVAWALGNQAADEVRVFEALRRVELEGLAREHISILSGGERQRLAMARAWALQPAFLLMDEPTANLDAHSVALMAALAQDLREQGSGLVIISHQSNDLTDLCERQWTLARGRLHEPTPLKIIERHDLKQRIQN